MRYTTPLLTATLVGLIFCFAAVGTAQTPLGTGNGALVGNDLTDLGDDGVEGSYAPPALGGFDAEFFSSNEPGFGGGEFAFNVFDNQTGGGQNKWCCGAGAANPITPQIVGARNFVGLGMDEGISLTSFTLTSSNDTPARDPRVWTLEGSNDTTDGLDGTWTAIYQRTDAGSSDWGNVRNQVIEYSDAADGFLTDEPFTAFRLNTTATGATTGAFHALSEIELFGNVTSTAVPEPASIAIWSLIGLCLAGFGYSRLRRKK